MPVISSAAMPSSLSGPPSTPPSTPARNSLSTPLGPGVPPTPPLPSASTLRPSTSPSPLPSTPKESSVANVDLLREHLAEITVKVSLSDQEAFEENVKFALYVFNRKTLSCGVAQQLRFGSFRQLRSELLAPPAEVLESAPFPQSYAKSKLGFGLTDSELASRAAGLETWFASLLSGLPFLPPPAVSLLHSFLFPSSPRPSSSSGASLSSLALQPRTSSGAVDAAPLGSRSSSSSLPPGSALSLPLRSQCVANTLRAAAVAENRAKMIAEAADVAKVKKEDAARLVSELRPPKIELQKALRTYVEAVDSLNDARRKAKEALKEELRETYCFLATAPQLDAVPTAESLAKLKRRQRAVIDSITAVRLVEEAASKLYTIKESSEAGVVLNLRFREGLGQWSVRRVFAAFEEDREVTPSNPPTLSRENVWNAVAAVAAESGFCTVADVAARDALLAKVAPKLPAGKALSFSIFEDLCNAVLKGRLLTLAAIEAAEATQRVFPPLNPFVPLPPLPLVRAFLAETIKRDAALLAAHSRSLFNASQRLTKLTAAHALASQNLESAKLRSSLLSRRAADVASDRWTAVRVFVAFDKDGDGTIDKDELSAALAACIGRRVADEEVANMIKRFDGSGDGRLQIEEFEGMEKALRGDLARAFIGLLWKQAPDEKGVTKGRNKVEEIEANLTDVYL